MKFYAIGKPNKQIRVCIQTADEAHARLQLAYGEVYIEVDGPVDGKINRDGMTITVAGIDMDVELDKIRERRTNLLARCDYTIFPDSPFTADEREAWAAYRQALRDITEDQPNATLDSIVWPEPPAQL